VKKLIIILLVAGCASVAGAEQFWIAWEGDDYPENEGWERYIRAGGAERSLQNGTLTLDDMADWHIVDEYFINRPLVPEPAEWFRMEWRLRVDELLGFADPGLFIRSEETGVVFLRYTESAVYSPLESVWIDFEPGLFHEFVFTSADMLSYQLHIDGQLAHIGSFVGPYPFSGVVWGNVTEGASSISTWDYVRFGMVPEPGAGLLLGLAGLPGSRRRILA